MIQLAEDPLASLNDAHDLRCRDMEQASAADRKIGLSIKALQEKEENNGVIPAEYISKAQEAPSTLGDLLKAAAEENSQK